MKTSLPVNLSQDQLIRAEGGRLRVPDRPVIPFIEGDGSGPDIWRAARRVFDAAVEKAYGGRREIQWTEVLAGEKAFHKTGNWLPGETLEAFRACRVGIKGPLTTPVGGGIRSLNVTLRKELDLYVCQRPVRWFPGVPSPVRRPELVDMVIFRENTEDVYSGLEFEMDSPENQAFLNLLRDRFPAVYKKIRFPESTAFGIKPISKEGSQRLARAAIQWALDHHRRSVTLVHKGNIMKFTEGAFRRWGYELAESEFGERVFTRMEWDRIARLHGEETANQACQEAAEAGRLWITDVITDAAFEIALTRPTELDVIATLNLNGDYLSDALAAQVGGIGIAPGGNINYQSGAAIFEATHGTAPALANKDVANPCSVILSGEMMFRHLGWDEAADRLILGVEGAIQDRTVTADFFAMLENASLLKTSEFGDAVIRRMG
ncbi:isocitrate dehydrogenase [Longilinea arvoryzae]|uniref:Isocitrate dehydrogenase [NADP] n=1 Tax=Longilinea arvoryzae TaxID=360412 RepID=A0A0S7BAE9_9CHLR|nr:NADP-dependent isocitrate dehydrogenase [Longilinea arvoryzae]GAP14487.1 isocitrate dehydrogenase [Longilinea arvoryzae]